MDFLHSCVSRSFPPPASWQRYGRDQALRLSGQIGRCAFEILALAKIRMFFEEKGRALWGGEKSGLLSETPFWDKTMKLYITTWYLLKIWSLDTFISYFQRLLRDLTCFWLPCAEKYNLWWSDLGVPRVPESATYFSSPQGQWVRPFVDPFFGR